MPTNPIAIAEPVLKSLAEPVLILDGALRAVLANPAFYTALHISEGELEGKFVQELIADDTGNPRLRLVLEAIAANEHSVRDVEVECTIPPQTQKVLLISAQHIATGYFGPQPELILVELRDVTREREATNTILELNQRLEHHAAELERINQELESFAHSVAHDLRMPLRLVSRVASVLREEHSDGLEPAGIEDIDMILNTTDEMGRLIESILTFSQVARDPLKKRRVDMDSLVRTAIDALKGEFEGRQVEFAIGELSSCRADRALLKEVWMNLLSNALKFTRECDAARIQIGCVHAAGAPVYFVQDNGVGFDAQASDSIFNVFKRLHSVQEFEGTGIGLALTRRIINRHGGRIWATGEEGNGAKFCFTLTE